MKRISLCLFFIISAFAVHGQSNILYNNTVSLIVSPTELNGIGLGYSYKCIYISAARGTYNLPDNGYLDDHYKLSAGYVKQINVDRLSKFCNLYSVGLIYHLYGTAHYKTLELNPAELFPVSFEVGAGAGIGRFLGMFRFDPLKWEASLSFGISF